MRLLLVRHGQTSSNEGGLLDTEEPGADLTDLGREQADALVAALGAEPADVVVASTLVRSQQTAAPLAASLALRVQVRDGIREIRAGDFEMLGDDESVRAYLDTVLRWTRGEIDLRMPGGETGAEVFGRFDAVVAEIAASGAGTAVVVSHGAMLRCWVAARASNVGTEFVAEHSLGNTGVVIMEGDPRSGWTVLTWEGHVVGEEELAPAAEEGPAAEPVPPPR